MFELPQPYITSNNARLLAVIPWKRDLDWVTIICYRRAMYVVADSRLPFSTQWEHGDYAIQTMQEALQVAFRRAGYENRDPLCFCNGGPG